MRHKQRPVKSSRHKSVTLIIDSHTSFGEHHQDSNAKPTLQSAASSSGTSKTSNNNLSRAQRAAAASANIPASSYGVATNKLTNSSSSSQHPHGLYQTNNSKTSNRSIGDLSDLQPQLMRKQFEHNYRHMSDVMRLAFLENNDIPIDDCTNVDFNSISTASILQRNIQQQLQQERREHLQMQHHQQQQQDQHQQIYHHQNQLNHRQQQQQQHFHHNQLKNHSDQELDANFDNLEDYDDISDNRIFATATPTSSSSQRNLVNYSNNNKQTPKASQRAGGSGTASSRRQDQASNNASDNRRRTRDSMPHVEFSNHVQVETIQNYGEGFFCDEPGCGKSFPSLRKLRHHKVVHSDDFPFVCEFKGCNKKFKRKFGIDLHSTTHFDLDPEMYTKTSNNSSLPFFGRRMQYSMCKPCNLKFKTVHEYQYHMLKHGKEPFKCPVKGCGQTFSIWKSFQKHRASHYFNYFCKMDGRCDHHTSNLQLLKLHIYCCHFRRKLPENATLASKDPAEDESIRDDPVDVVDKEEEDEEENLSSQQQVAVEDEEDDEMALMVETPQQSMASTPRRDSRLRKNPPRSSTFGQHDYASISNGSSFVKSSPSTPQSKRTRSAAKSQQSQHQSQMDLSGSENDYIQDPDFSISDSGIFATATPTTSSSRLTNSSTSKDSQKTTNSSQETKKRLKDSTPKTVMSSPVKQETVQRYADGFFCDEPGCGKYFPSLRKLRHHKVVHSDDFPFVCEFKGCNKKFKRKFGIDLHSTTHFDLDPEMYTKTSNNSSLPFFGRRMQYSMCKPCGVKFKTVHEYQYHMLKHGKEPFKCPVKGCGQTFSIWKSFQKHRASHYFNYFCKMDGRCDHHTSNLQLLKLHIYCCHFRRKLPENATLASKDPAEDDSIKDESIDVVDNGEDVSSSQLEIAVDVEPDEEQQLSVTETPQEPKADKSTPSTPRRDSRLRKNPPRSSTFGQQDYASINNGASFAKSISCTANLKRTRSAISSTGSSQQLVGSPSVQPPEKKMKLPLKVLPKRSAQRLPMSLIADDGSTEDDGSGSECDSLHNDRDDEDNDQDPAKRNRFKCHLCDYKFSVRFQLTKHLSTHLELTPEMYSATADKQVVQLSERRRREFYCDKCNVKFERMPDLDNHMRKHGQRPYICNFCQVPSTFRLAKQYLSHLYEHRFNYKCTMSPECDFTINRKDALKLHIFRMHLNQQLPSYIENFANLIDCNEWPEQ